MRNTEEMESMPATELNVIETETEKVERWRAEVLENAGYDLDSAHQLAARPDVDLHRAIELIESGCPQELALQILL
jgi:hypothetical protein